MKLQVVQGTTIWHKRIPSLASIDGIFCIGKFQTVIVNLMRIKCKKGTPTFLALNIASALVVQNIRRASHFNASGLQSASMVSHIRSDIQKSDLQMRFHLPYLPHYLALQTRNQQSRTSYRLLQNLCLNQVFLSQFLKVSRQFWVTVNFAFRQIQH